MPSKVAKWGNSLAVRLPMQAIQQAGLRAGDNVDVVAREDGSLVITPIRHKHDLDDLLNGITAENLHGETKWGGPQGGEAW